jgi:NAD(P)-dependent dehydrogenase (short-subunit alcohol dehydrogenase family)
MKPQTILITGATSGIGRFTALHLAQRGHRVIATGRNEKALAELKANALGQLETLRLDVTDGASIASAKSAVSAMTNGAGLDVLVNNAGYGMLGPTEMITDDDMRAQYETNVFGLMAMTRAFLPQMRARGAGRIVNVSSLGGRYTLPLFGVYNSTKYAVESLSDALRVELAPFGVRVSLIEPGVIATNFTDRSMDGIQKYSRADSPYAPVFERAEDMRKMSDRTAVGPLCVARAIESAATSRRPRARYVAPLRAQIMVGFLRSIPTRWADFIMGQVMGLTRRRFARVLPVLAAAFVLAMAMPRASFAGDSNAGWEKIRTEDGILVSKKEVPGSPFVAFRGEGDVNAPMLLVGSVLVDIARDNEWVDSVAEARILRRVSLTEYVTYSHVKTPITMSDRDFVMDVTLAVDAPTRSLTVRMHSVEDPSAPKTSYVRGQIEESSWTFTASPDGKTTHVVAEIHCDPKGSVAGWIVNLFQKSWGYNTIHSLRAQVAKPGIAVHPTLAKVFEEKGLT